MTGTASRAVHTGRPSVKRPPRRVLWVMKGLGRGGAERLTVSSTRLFDSSRWRVDVAYVLPGKDALVGDLRDVDIAAHCVGLAGTRVGWAYELARLVTTGDYDLVHTHSPLPAIVVRAIPSGRRPPVVHTEHNLWPRYQAVTRLGNALTFRRNVGALAVSDGVAASMHRRFGGPRVTVLHHGIDLARSVHVTAARAAARATLGLPSAAPALGTVANFTPKKDHATLLEAVAAMAPAHPDLRVLLIGSGPLEQELRVRARTLNLERSVVFTGSRGDVADILPALDVFVLSSRYEGLPVSLLEAMASGVPPVATAVGGVPEVVTDGRDGLLVPAGQPAALATAIGRLLDDVDLRSRLGAAARERARDFDIARAVRFMEQWYEEILA
jgi:glycosyltransferase involved in cell wall biosynthesis